MHQSYVKNRQMPRNVKQLNCSISSVLGKLLIFIMWVYFFAHFLAQKIGFHFVLEEASRLHIADGVRDIIPDLSTDKLFLRVLTVVFLSADHLFYEFRILRSEFSS